jgi:predicted RNA-binding Zn-ribbon protein involved in translation (DUF1610 family)
MIVVAKNAPICTSCGEFIPSIYITVGPANTNEYVVVSFCPACLKELREKLEQSDGV